MRDLRQHRVWADRADDAAEYDIVVVATGATPDRPPLPDPGCAVLDAPAAIVAPAAVRGPVLVADWGGGCAGLDAAEVHQYQRNLYLARLDDRGVRIVHHAELAHHDGRVVLRHVFSGRISPLPDGLGRLVLAQGRKPGR